MVGEWGSGRGEGTTLPRALAGMLGKARPVAEGSRGVSGLFYFTAFKSKTDRVCLEL